MKNENEKKISQQVLSWYKKNSRSFPWRNNKKNPYITWVSEIMLQQTGTKTVIPYFTRFINKWPNIQSLANAPKDTLMQMWSGLGYYKRAHWMHDTANICKKTGLPDTLDQLLNLPGIGLYTANAILAIGFNKKAAAVDGNVERVFSRLLAINKPISQTKQMIYQYVMESLPDNHFGDYAQGLMDIGATICIRGKPKCDLCPLNAICKGKYTPHLFPIKPFRKIKERNGFALLIYQNNQLLIGKRPPGLLGGLFSIPTSYTQTFTDQIIKSFEYKKRGIITHTFSHFKLTLHLFQITIPSNFDIVSYIKSSNLFDHHDPYIWIDPQNIKNYAFPSIIKKVFAKIITKIYPEKE